MLQTYFKKVIVGSYISVYHVYTMLSSKDVNNLLPKDNMAILIFEFL